MGRVRRYYSSVHAVRVNLLVLEYSCTAVHVYWGASGLPTIGTNKLLRIDVQLYPMNMYLLRPRVEDVTLCGGCEVGTSGGMRRSLCVPIVGSQLAPQ